MLLEGKRDAYYYFKTTCPELTVEDDFMPIGRYTVLPHMERQRTEGDHYLLLYRKHRGNR
jgi:hypothetical protein